MSPENVNSQIAMVICSYRPDFERCARLCASLDALISPEVSQTIIVPHRDRAHFAQLESGNRTVVSTDEVLPARYIHLPL